MLQKVPEPSPESLGFLQEWMKRPSMGGVYLVGLDSDVWEKPIPGDMVALWPDQSSDTFTSWIRRKVIPRYHQIVGRYYKVRFISLS